jgi:hypothetical protein
LTSRRLFTKKFVLAGQTAYFAYYCDILWQHENVLRLIPTFGDKRTDSCIMTKHHLTLSFSQGNFLPKITWLSTPTHPTQLTWRPPTTFLFPAIFTHYWGDQGRIASSAERPRRTKLPGCILKMAEVQGRMHTCGRGLLWWWWWPVGPKLVFDQMAAPVPEFKDGSLYVEGQAVT